MSHKLLSCVVIILCLAGCGHLTTTETKMKRTYIPACQDICKEHPSMVVLAEDEKYQCECGGGE